MDPPKAVPEKSQPPEEITLNQQRWAIVVSEDDPTIEAEPYLVCYLFHSEADALQCAETATHEGWDMSALFALLPTADKRAGCSTGATVHSEGPEGDRGEEEKNECCWCVQQVFGRDGRWATWEGGESEEQKQIEALRVCVEQVSIVPRTPHPATGFRRIPNP